MKIKNFNGTTYDVNIINGKYKLFMEGGDFVNYSKSDVEHRVTTKTWEVIEEEHDEFVLASEVVNHDDKEYTGSNAFLLTLGSYGEHKFTVYASNLQDALELLGVYCKDKGYTGLLEDDYSSLMEQWDNDEECIAEHWTAINGGEYYLAMPGYCQEVTLK